MNHELANLTVAHGQALLRMLNAKDFHVRQAAEREYAVIDRQLLDMEAHLRKIAQPSHYAPMSGSARDLL